MTRNPIYSGLLAGSVGVAVLRRRVTPLLSAGVLGLVLGAKVRLEERALEARFGAQYRTYAARTPRLVPRRRHRPSPTTGHRPMEVSWPRPGRC
jgi:protein-S-isoprenylcysteine O-methyltransferase Ste14